MVQVPWLWEGIGGAREAGKEGEAGGRVGGGWLGGVGQGSAGEYSEMTKER